MGVTASSDVGSSSVGETSSVEAASATVGQTSGPTSATSSATGPSQCDGSGNCGDGGAGCIGCAITVTCAGIYDACVQSQECIAYSDCAGQCPDPQCLDKCGMSFPEGAGLYDALVVCVICDACYFDCDGASAGCAAPG